jgi:hypothetical protein
MSPSREYDQFDVCQLSTPRFDSVVAAKIVELHKKYPKLGHHRIFKALNDEGIKVQPDELEEFPEGKQIQAEKPFKPMKFRGAPSWLGGDPRGDQ